MSLSLSPAASARRRDQYNAAKLGPRAVGVIYVDGYWNTVDEVLAVEYDADGYATWITERTLAGGAPENLYRVRRHLTSWHKRSYVVTEGNGLLTYQAIAQSLPKL